MKLTFLKLVNFRNYLNLEVSFHPNLNIIYGKNGSGKTNLVEAIYVLALTRSFRIVGDKTLDFDGLRDLEDNETAIEPGIEAFGDYNWIIHNLRLPTAANTGFWAVTKNEMPVPGGNYVQFIVRMCVERDGIAGQVVGNRATSVTTHVFYVLDQGTNVATIKTELAKLTTIKTDADDALADPYANA